MVNSNWLRVWISGKQIDVARVESQIKCFFQPGQAIFGFRKREWLVAGSAFP
jgi:hypothetical protein